ncbi:hypothetical protein STPH1_1581 [Streptomyces sp. OM5714]|nr:hypothetical protein STPH1_1581 [Streptomyces sp. OM5714]
MEDALPWYERAASNGDTNAARKAAHELCRAARFGEAQRWFERAAADGSSSALRWAADRLVMADRLDDALPWYERAAAKGDANSLQVAAGQLANAGRKDESLAWFWRAADAGVSLGSGWFPDLSRELLGDDVDVLLRYGRDTTGRLAHRWRLTAEPEES